MEDGEGEPGQDGEPARAVQGLLGWAQPSRAKRVPLKGQQLGYFVMSRVSVVVGV